MSRDGILAFSCLSGILFAACELGSPWIGFGAGMAVSLIADAVRSRLIKRNPTSRSEPWI